MTRHTFAILALLLFAPLALGQTLRIYAIDCGQGSSTLLVGPTGISMLIDGGPDQSGWKSNPSGPGPVAQAITAAGIAQLDSTLLTHYHSDHYEGLTELAQQNFLKPGAKAYDRGNSPAPENGFTAAINAYIAAMGSKRATITPGQVIDLGGGATVRCLVVAGAIAGGPTIGTASSAQEENSNSIAVLVKYNDFEMWIGGDLTGGGGGTTDVETAVAPYAGDVDVYVADHHGSSTSSAAGFINTILPELAIASCGVSNSYNHPSGTFLNNTNKATRSILTYSTTGGADGDGYGNRGFVNSTGTIAIETDGKLYSVAPKTGPQLTIACDEWSASYATAQAGDLRISEFMADPAAVPDSAGEWLEIVNVSSLARNLAGLKFSQSDGSANLVTFATPVLLKPGARFLVGNDGDSQRNGGFVAVHSWPYNVFFLDASDSVLVRNASNATVESLVYTSSFPDAAGVAAQRIDVLNNASSASNWSAAAVSYGLGDKGTPGAKNPSETTAFPAKFTSSAVPAVGQPWTANFTSFNEPGKIYLALLSQSTSPPLFAFYGQNFPLQQDSLLIESLNIPGYLGFLDADGFAQATVQVPNDPAFHGYAFFGAVGTYAFPSLAPGKVSAAQPLLIP